MSSEGVLGGKARIFALLLAAAGVGGNSNHHVTFICAQSLYPNSFRFFSFTATDLVMETGNLSFSDQTGLVMRLSQAVPRTLRWQKRCGTDCGFQASISQ